MGLRNKALKKLDNNNKKTNNSIKKMGYSSEQRVLNRGISNDWKSLKKFLNILSNQENKNQNNSETPS